MPDAAASLTFQVDTSSPIIVKRDKILSLWASVVSERLGQPKSDDVWKKLEKAFAGRMSEVRVAMEMLANRFTPDELNRCSYELYTQFKPATPKKAAFDLTRITEVNLVAKARLEE